MIKLKQRPSMHEPSGALKQSSKQKVCFSIRYHDLYALSCIGNLETKQNNITILLSLHKNVQPIGFCDTYPQINPPFEKLERRQVDFWLIFSLKVGVFCGAIVSIKFLG